MKLNYVVFIILFLLSSICLALTGGQNKNYSNVQNTSLVAFDKNNFDGSSYTLDGTLYISERILFPAVINNQKIMLEMNIDRPNDDKKYPVLILTHGRNGPFPDKRSLNACKTFDSVKDFFLKEGLIVAQLSRRGAGLSEGSDMDEYKMTPIDSGREMVKDIKQALIYLQSKSYADKNKFVVGGRSQGGWAALTTASANLKGVKAIINFSGATNYRTQPWSKDWPQKANLDFVRDCKVLAKTAKIPSLWIYGDSEELHPENNIKAMYNAYEQSGGQADLLILPNTGHDTTSHQSQKLWSKTCYDFLLKNKIIAN